MSKQKSIMLVLFIVLPIVWLTGCPTSTDNNGDANKVENPSFSIEGRTYFFPQDVLITTATPGAMIYYTTDGTTPTRASTPYSQAVSIISTTTLKAIAIKEGMTDSDIASALYTITPLGETINSYMDIVNNKIYDVSPQMEYSLNDGQDWYACDSSVIDVTFSVGDKVWVRITDDAVIERYLGEVASLSGPDLSAGDQIYIGFDNWGDLFSGAPGDSLKIMFWFENIGTASGYDSAHRIRFYLSVDHTITETDTLLLDYPYDYDCPVGEVYGGQVDFSVPSVTPGTYYVGCIIDATDVISEMNEGNNITLPGNTAEFIVENASPHSEGACKFINSWGNWGSWENIHDGHYWVTYETMKKQEMIIYYYYNDYTHIYEPSVVAVFKLTHVERDDCKVVCGLGDPVAPYMKKELQSRLVDTLLSGPEPFPDNTIVLDISEFASAINDFDLFLSIENSGSIVGTIDSFSVEFYSDYDSAPFNIISGGTETIPASGTVSVVASTKGSLTPQELMGIKPLPRSDMYGTYFFEEKPSEQELLFDMESCGVYIEGKNYNEILYEGFGTGAHPPTREQWLNMKKLRAVGAYTALGTLPDSIDLSATRFFPPIGSQGDEGSCAAFSLGYYIHTYTEAKEHNWDLRGTGWSYPDPSGRSIDGIPDGNLDKIFNPDFIYHQINEGVDEGSNFSMAASLIIRVGCATWSKMPYDTEDHTSWPSEEAWREACRYRGREVGNHYWDFITSGYFVIQNDSDINLLKTLIHAGYCVSTGINAGPDGLYDLLDSNDVVDRPDVGRMEINHAQTIVGYKEGSAWDKTDPDG